MEGEFKKEIFRSDNGFLIALFKVSDSSKENYKNKSIVITGNFPDFSFFENYRLEGEFVVHHKYGEQFKVNNYKRLKKEGKNAIVSFLSSDLFKGIGSKKALDIYNKFKDNSLDIIKEDPERLKEVKSLSKKDQDLLHNELIKYDKTYNNIIYLTDLGFSMNDSLDIIKYYPFDLKELIEEDIYRFYFNLDLDFKRLDKIAIDNSYTLDDKRRIKALIIYVFKYLRDSSGHIYLLQNEIYKMTLKESLTSFTLEYFLDILEELIKDRRIIKEEDRYYLLEDYLDEVKIANEVVERLNKSTTFKSEKLNKIYKENIDNDYNKEQEEAIKRGVLDNFLIITGGPGTGKTTIIREIVKLSKLYYEKENIKLLAPTGRASKRLSVLSSTEAMTIHRFLEWNMDKDTFNLNEYNKSDATLVIIDEFSMVNNNLFASLLRALNDNTRIIIVGDSDQLPSVSCGNLLKDLLLSVENQIKLKRIYRQSENSEILKLAYSFNLDHELFLDSENNLEVISCDDLDIVDNVLDIAYKYKDNYLDFQVLAPIYKGLVGIDTLNEKLQRVLNPKSLRKKEIRIGNILYREFDKVIQLVNMPDFNVFNGDLGIIKQIKKDEIVIDFDGNLVRYTKSNFSNFKLAYAISIHKSQGSEFKYTLITLSNYYYNMLYKKLYYTGITRAKNKLYLVGDMNALSKAQKNDREELRNTTLEKRINVLLNK